LEVPSGVFLLLLASKKDIFFLQSSLPFIFV
jgi:hypothetical protein